MAAHRAAACLAAALSAFMIGSALAAPQEPPAPGQKATWTDAAGDHWCVTVTSVRDGPGGLVWVWGTVDADPRRVASGTPDAFTRGCGPAVARKDRR